MYRACSLHLNTTKRDCGTWPGSDGQVATLMPGVLGQEFAKSCVDNNDHLSSASCHLLLHQLTNPGIAEDEMISEVVGGKSQHGVLAAMFPGLEHL